MHHMRLLVLRRAMQMGIMIQLFDVNVWFKPRCGPLRIMRVSCIDHRLYMTTKIDVNSSTIRWLTFVRTKCEGPARPSSGGVAVIGPSSGVQRRGVRGGARFGSKKTNVL